MESSEILSELRNARINCKIKVSAYHIGANLGRLTEEHLLQLRVRKF